ncbi:9544_t:CDS:2, partial [Cetraspora pellucida]
MPKRGLNIKTKKATQKMQTNQDTEESKRIANKESVTSILPNQQVGNIPSEASISICPNQQVDNIPKISSTLIPLNQQVYNTPEASSTLIPPNQQ